MSNIICETYRTVELDTTEHDEAAANRRKEFREFMGLDKQAEEVIRKREYIEMQYPEITSFINGITWLFPTNYVQSPGQHSSARSFASYAYDTIPDEVLEEMVYCKREKLFDYISIRTPERACDPIALGVIVQPRWTPDLFFLIARWGEALVPLWALKKASEMMYHLAYYNLNESKRIALLQYVASDPEGEKAQFKKKGYFGGVKIASSTPGRPLLRFR